MWKAWVSRARFSMVQSSTAPTFVVITGFSFGIKDFLRLSIDRDVELNRSVGSAEFLGEIELALSGNRLLLPGRELQIGRIAGVEAAGACAALRVRELECWREFVAESRLPVGPVEYVCGNKRRAALPKAEPDTINSARPAGGIRIVVCFRVCGQRIPVKRDHLADVAAWPFHCTCSCRKS